MPLAGDVLLCTPLLTALRKTYPGADIHVLVVRGFAGVLEGNPDVDQVIEVSVRPDRAEISKLLLGNFRHYDLLLSNSTSDRMSSYGFMLGRYRVYVVPPRHLGMPWKAWLHDLHTEVDIERLHTLVQTNKLGELIGIKPGHTIVLPASPASAGTLEKALGQEWDRQPYVVVHPCGSRPIKNWQAAGWRAVIADLLQRDLRVVISGGPAQPERDFIESELSFDTDRVVSLAGKLQLADVAVLLEGCALYVGVDTLVSHMAAAAGAPTIALFGATHPDIWGPWPMGCEAAESPFRREGHQRVNNVQILKASADAVSATDGIHNLDADTVIAAANVLLQ